MYAASAAPNGGREQHFVGIVGTILTTMVNVCGAVEESDPTDVGVPFQVCTAPSSEL